MSQVKLALRPASNDDFVQGYPGIPFGGQHRPRASVKGAIEVSAGPQGVKAKWVRIELRKLETLPGGGISNTFYGAIGPRPINLWASSDEYRLLRTQDFAFSIPIPESIPPSVELDDRAGVQYQLVASLLMKGKKRFLRRRKSVVLSTRAAVTIDKHELHSTWPVYNQPESRQVVQDDCTMVVERNQTCYGPGDRIAVVVRFRSGTLDNIILRFFELTLNESTIFRAGSRSSATPQARIVTISESQLVVNAPLYAGTEREAELTCAISPTHTTTSLISAKHIDVTYILSVKAIVDQRPPILLDLPVIISNWPKVVSQEAVRRIGPAPGLSPLPMSHAQHSIQRSNPLPPVEDDYRVSRRTPISALSVLPLSSWGSPPAKVDELGGYVHSMKSTRSSYTASNDRVNEFGAVHPEYMATTLVGRKPVPVSASTAKRLSITEGQPREKPQPDVDASQRNRIAPDNKVSHSTPGPSADEEQQRLYKTTRAKVERSKGSVARVNAPVATPRASLAAAPFRSSLASTPEDEQSYHINRALTAFETTQKHQPYSPPASPDKKMGLDEGDAAGLARQPSSTARLHPPQNSSPKVPLPQYLTAEHEQEKAALKRYEEAKIAVERGQNVGYQSIEGMGDPRTSAGTSIQKQSQAAQLHPPTSSARTQALAKHPRATASPQNSSRRVPPPPYSLTDEKKATLKRYEEAKMAVERAQNSGTYEDLTAEQEKAALKRYEEAKMAVERAQNSGAHEDASTISSDPPLSFDSPATLLRHSHLSEKESFHRAYEERGAAILDRQSQNTPPRDDSPPSFSCHAPIPAPVNHTQGLSEAEVLGRKFEVQLNASASRVTPPQRPSRRIPISISPPGTMRLLSAGSGDPRPVPVPPASHGNILTAAEEKALLKARYAERDAGAVMQHQEEQQIPRRVPPPQHAAADEEKGLTPTSLPGMRLPLLGDGDPRSIPMPPTSPGKILTAAEEQGLLKARYAAQDAGAVMQHQEEQQHPQRVPLPQHATTDEEKEQSHEPKMAVDIAQNARYAVEAVPPDETSIHRHSDTSGELGMRVQEQDDPPSDDTSTYHRSHLHMGRESTNKLPLQARQEIITNR